MPEIKSHGKLFLNKIMLAGGLPASAFSAGTGVTRPTSFQS